MVWVEPHAKRFPISIRVLERGWDQVLLEVYGPEVAQREWPVVRGVVDGPPQVDDLEAMLQELWGVACGKVAVDASRCRLSGLVDMHRGNWLALLWAIVWNSRAAAANGYTKFIQLPARGGWSLDETYCGRTARSCSRL